MKIRKVSGSHTGQGEECSSVPQFPAAKHQSGGSQHTADGAPGNAIAFCPLQEHKPGKDHAQVTDPKLGGSQCPGHQQKAYPEGAAVRLAVSPSGRAKGSQRLCGKVCRHSSQHCHAQIQRQIRQVDAPDHKKQSGGNTEPGCRRQSAHPGTCPPGQHKPGQHDHHQGAQQHRCIPQGSLGHGGKQAPSQNRHPLEGGHHRRQGDLQGGGKFPEPGTGQQKSADTGQQQCPCLSPCQTLGCTFLDHMYPPTFSIRFIATTPHALCAMLL